jgi:DNA-binding protein H-NS
MGRPSDLERMSFAELAELELRIGRLKVQKQNEARSALREQMSAMAMQHGFDLRELMDGRGKGKRGTVAIKYRDPKNPENTWTGRGRMPRWMVAATKGSKSKKEDFLIK